MAALATKRTLALTRPHTRSLFGFPSPFASSSSSSSPTPPRKGTLQQQGGIWHYREHKLMPYVPPTLSLPSSHCPCPTLTLDPPPQLLALRALHRHRRRRQLRAVPPLHHVFARPARPPRISLERRRREATTARRGARVAHEGWRGRQVGHGRRAEDWRNGVRRGLREPRRDGEAQVGQGASLRRSSSRERALPP